ncbi:uncharacterized protein EV154DRAFT_590858 [Mucor mucedo]|uniref:uncharacterized protein n=1 Tax=Mucor mucedo TaxID=29922 RepID=UPI00221ED0EB|nr:uncharacterized protein EV154DRAFT_590858 [Mucor mucedo]KAI7896225.1 hypothetical protein EV154DRAFT_590858 [Mucor mucedo]
MEAIDNWFLSLSQSLFEYLIAVRYKGELYLLVEARSSATTIRNSQKIRSHIARLQHERMIITIFFFSSAHVFSCKIVAIATQLLYVPIPKREQMTKDKVNGKHFSGQYRFMKITKWMSGLLLFLICCNKEANLNSDYELLGFCICIMVMKNCNVDSVVWDSHSSITLWPFSSSLYLCSVNEKAPSKLYCSNSNNWLRSHLVMLRKKSSFCTKRNGHKTQTMSKKIRSNHFASLTEAVIPASDSTTENNNSTSFISFDSDQTYAEVLIYNEDSAERSSYAWIQHLAEKISIKVNSRALYPVFAKILYRLQKPENTLRTAYKSRPKATNDYYLKNDERAKTTFNLGATDFSLCLVTPDMLHTPEKWRTI